MKLFTSFLLISFYMFNSCNSEIKAEKLEVNTKEIEVNNPKSLIDYYLFNDYILAVTDLSKIEENYYAYKVVLQNKDSIMLEDMMLEGNKYELGKWELLDWNKNGKLELKYSCNHPTSSVAHSYLKEEIYSVNENRFNKDFEIIIDERECTPVGDSLKREVTRKYIVETETNIKVIETHYTFPCENFEFKKEIKNKTLTNQLEYNMIWNEGSLKFCKLKK